MQKLLKSSVPLSGRAIWMTIGFCLIFPNLLFFLAAYNLGVARPVVNLDYIFASLFFVLGWRALPGFLLVFCLIVDSLVLQSLVYPVVDLQNLYYLLTLLPYAALVWQAAAVVLVIVFVFITVIFFYYGHKASRLVVLILLLFATSLYAIQNQLDEPSSDFYRSKTTILGSQMAYFANLHAIEFFDVLFKNRNPLVPIGFPGATEQWARGTAETLNKKILFVIAESWGVMQDERIQQALLQPLYARKDAFEWMSVGQAPGEKATLDAELHGLCGMKIFYYNMKEVVDGYENCLPHRLGQFGYATAAVHGAVDVMYDRKYWYPRAGFDAMHFSNTDEWTSRCYSFPGVCDSEIMTDFIVPAFARDGKSFMYWLTLNTHSQFDKRDIHLDIFDCQQFGLKQDGELCRMNKLHAQFFSQFADMLMQPSMKGVEVFVMGDHSPPILDRNEFKRHMKDELVMQLHLKVKD